MKYLILFITLFLSSVLFISCSELKDDIPTSTDINIHGSEVFDTTASNYHGKHVLDSQNSFQDCKQCHDANYSGGITKVSCYSSDCHVSPAINVHEIGITDVQSPNFHGKFIADKIRMISCAQCHGDSYQGGVVSPSCADCHAGIPVHVDDYISSSSPNFHGKFIADKVSGSMISCAQCHGDSYQGGIASPSCANCHEGIPVHVNDFTNPNSPDFHGKFIADNFSGSMNSCAQCHGDSFQGGVASPTCTNCHATIPVHVDGIVNPGSPNFHGKFIASNIGWDIQECGTCHSSDYSGGVASPTCLTCHTNENGPESCNTCHGDFEDPSKIAPPKALSGATLSSERGVGAHTKHLSSNLLGKAVECSECHTVPNGFDDPSHLDQTPGAELVFGDLATLATNVPGGFNYQPSLGDFIPNASFSFAQGTCANTYCHGYFKNGNLDNVVSFTAESQGSACGTCHGDPATGNPLPRTTSQGGVHPSNQNCEICHGDVVSVQGNNYTIIDKNKHINGKLNFGGQEYTY